MIYLLLSIFCATMIVVVFKLYPKFEIDTFQAIVINYWVCIGVGAIMMGGLPIEASTFAEPWMPYALVLGLLFITGFYAVGNTVAFFGLTVASVLQKMSLVISVPFAILMFSESAPAIKIVGLVLALAAVVFTNWPSKGGPGVEEAAARSNYLKKGGSPLLLWIFPFYAFAVSGGIEVIIQYVQDSMIHGDAEANFFTTFLFGTAAVLGTIALLYQLIRGKTRLKGKNILAGIALGIPNYFSIVFLILAFEWWDKSVVLPVNNIAVVSVTAILGFIVFKERLQGLKLFGVILAIIAIILISWKQGKMDVDARNYAEKSCFLNRTNTIETVDRVRAEMDSIQQIYEQKDKAVEFRVLVKRYAAGCK